MSANLENHMVISQNDLSVLVSGKSNDMIVEDAAMKLSTETLTAQQYKDCADELINNLSLLKRLPA